MAEGSRGRGAPALLDHLARRHQQFDALIFFTYLYAPTVLGLQIAPGRSILVPTAHDEPAIHLDIYKEMFSLPAAVAYNTDVERRFLTTHFPIRAVAEETVGCGVDLPSSDARERPAEDRATRCTSPTPTSAASTATSRCRRTSPSAARCSAAVTGCTARSCCTAGASIPGKGCEELIEYFSSYVADGGDATLALMGVKLMKLPDEPFIRFAGLLSERERLQALEAATVVSVPSPYESLSLLALEAFAVGTPILANARSEVLVEHCVRSNAGLYYADRDEFVEAPHAAAGRRAACAPPWAATGAST